jgi:hypothetical protein
LTLKNAIADLVYFAQNVDLPFDSNGASHAPKVVSILSSFYFLPYNLCCD